MEPKEKKKNDPQEKIILENPPQFFVFSFSVDAAKVPTHKLKRNQKTLSTEEPVSSWFASWALLFFFFFFTHPCFYDYTKVRKERLEMELASPSPMQWAAPRALFSWKEHQLRPVFSFWRFFFLPLVSTVSAALVGTSSSLAPIGATA